MIFALSPWNSARATAITFALTGRLKQNTQTMIQDFLLLIKKIAVGVLLFLIPLGIIGGLLWYFGR